jgi:hypothetical protein
VSEERKPFWVKCGKCSHCWAPAYAPMPLEEFAKATGRAICPMCGNGPKNIFVAKQKDGKLLEGQEGK